MKYYESAKKGRLSLPYDDLLARARSSLQKDTKGSASRLELPEPAVIWVGNKTIFRNFADFPKFLRRDPNRLLMYLAKELATAASIDGERAIFIGRKDKASFMQLMQRFMKEYVTCPVCGSPDTHLDKEKRIDFIVCEACGARSVVKVA